MHLKMKFNFWSIKKASPFLDEALDILKELD